MSVWALAALQGLQSCADSRQGQNDPSDGLGSQVPPAPPHLPPFPFGVQEHWDFQKRPEKGPLGCLFSVSTIIPTPFQQGPHSANSCTPERLRSTLQMRCTATVQQSAFGKFHLEPPQEPNCGLRRYRILGPQGGPRKLCS